MTLNFQNDVTCFWIHADGLAPDGRLILDGSPIDVSAEYDFWILTKNITSGAQLNLVINFTSDAGGKNIWNGFDWSTNDDPGKNLAVANFKNQGARKVFPCLDDPTFRTTFDIRITAPNTYKTVLSNIKTSNEALGDDSHTVTLEQTPEIPISLIALVVSKFDCPLKICTPTAENLDETIVALELPARVLYYMKSYTNFNYDNTALDNLVQIISDSDTENWGFISYKETELLWNHNETSELAKQTLVTTIAQKLARQWFGNLVPSSPDNFLIEGFVKYFGYHISHLIFPRWRLDEQFVVTELQKALLHSVNPDLPLMHSDKITVIKGASLIRMVQYVMGIDSFRTGIANIISNCKFENSTPECRWGMFQPIGETLPPGTDLSIIMRNWTEEGYPLLTVASDGDKIIITQEPFATGDTQWYVPITYATSTGNTTTTEWLIPGQDLKLPNFHYILLNNQQTGYYRVKYDDKLLLIISDTLKRNPRAIPETSRAQLVDDILNLARAGKKSYTEVLDFLAFLEKDDSYFAWSAAFNGLSYLVERMADYEVLDSLMEYILGLMKALKASAPLKEQVSHIAVLKQVLTQTWACNLGDRACIQFSKDQFQGYKMNQTSVDPNLKSIVYCTALRHSDNASGDFDFLWEKYQNSSASEKVTILKSLGCVNDISVRLSLLEYVRNGKIRPEYAQDVFYSVVSNGGEALMDFVNFLTDNWSQLEEIFDEDETILPFAISVVASFVNKRQQVNQMNQLLAIGGESLEAKISAAIESATKNCELATDLKTLLRSYFDTNGTKDAAAGFTLGTAILIFAFPLYVSFTGN